jgi:hypothetical protein
MRRRDVGAVGRVVDLRMRPGASQARRAEHEEPGHAGGADAAEGGGPGEDHELVSQLFHAMVSV